MMGKTNTMLAQNILANKRPQVPNDTPSLPPLVINPAEVDKITVALEKNQQCKCQSCGKLFTSVWYLKQHAVKHSNDRPFRCRFCKKTYKFRSNLYQHKCLERLKYFSKQHFLGRQQFLNQELSSQLSSEMRNDSPNINRLRAVMPSDQEELQVNEELQTSSEQNTKEEVKQDKKIIIRRRISKASIQRYLDENKDKFFQCRKCHRIFPSKGYFHRHLIQHADDERLSYWCNLCPERFASKHSLYNHHKEHKENSEIRCSQCSAPFRSFLSLRWHQDRFQKCRFTVNDSDSNVDETNSFNAEYGFIDLKYIPEETIAKEREGKIYEIDVIAGQNGDSGVGSDSSVSEVVNFEGQNKEGSNSSENTVSGRVQRKNQTPNCTPSSSHSSPLMHISHNDDFYMGGTPGGSTLGHFFTCYSNPGSAQVSSDCFYANGDINGQLKTSSVFSANSSFSPNSYGTSVTLQNGSTACLQHLSSSALSGTILLKFVAKNVLKPILRELTDALHLYLFRLISLWISSNKTLQRKLISKIYLKKDGLMGIRSVSEDDGANFDFLNVNNTGRIKGSNDEECDEKTAEKKEAICCENRTTLQ